MSIICRRGPKTPHLHKTWLQRANKRISSTCFTIRVPASASRRGLQMAAPMSERLKHALLSVAANSPRIIGSHPSIPHVKRASVALSASLFCSCLCICIHSICKSHPRQTLHLDTKSISLCLSRSILAFNYYPADLRRRSFYIHRSSSPRSSRSDSSGKSM